MIDPIDLGIVVGYFVFILSLGFMFRKQITDISEYFRGGGKMLWWMTGSSAFMTTFSAWTFTGAAGKAYVDGFPVVVIFLANALAYFICARFLAAKYRQLRVDTPLEAYKKRYGRFNEQFNLWVGFLSSQLPGGLTLISVSVFVSAMFGWDLQLTILITGAVVLLITLTGGAWAVVASDFMQAMLIVAITVVTGYYALDVMGGFQPIIEQFPAESFFAGNGINHMSIYLLWIVATVIQRLHDINNMNGSVRFLAAKDSHHSRKGAMLAACLFGAASLIWFLPPMVSAILYPDLGAMYPNLNNPSEASYLAFVANVMPVGMLGLLVAAMFAATMSSMDSSLNGGAAMLVKCFYKPILHPQASEKEVLNAGRGMTLILGCVQIAIAIVISGIEGVSLFSLMLGFIGLLGLPMVIPNVMLFIFRKTPDWSAWSTALFGLVVSYFVGRVFNGAWFNDTFNMGLTAREVGDFNMVIIYAAHLTLTVGWFLFTTRFYKPLSAQRQAEVDEFYHNLDTPVVSPEGVDATDTMQRRRLGMMTTAFGLFVLALMIFSDGYLAFIGCGGILLTIGLLLIRSSRAPSEAQTLQEAPA